jgi:hypothetical protein
MSMRSPLIVALSFSWSSVRFFGTMWPHTWHMFKSPYNSLQQVPCEIPTFLATAFPWYKWWCYHFMQ